MDAGGTDEITTVDGAKRKDPLSVLIIQPWIRVGGAELLSVHLANELQKRRHRVAIACTFADLSDMPQQAHRVPYLLPPRWLSRLCQRSRSIFLVLGPWLLLALVWKHSRRVDVLNPHNFPASWIAVLVGTFRRIPIVWTCNEPPVRVRWRDAAKVGFGDFLGWLVASSWIDRFLTRQVTAIYVHDEKIRQLVFDRYGRQANLIRPGIDAELFWSSNGTDLPDRHDFRDKFVLLTVGKLHPQKNQILCLEALRTVLDRVPETILVLAGDGPMTEAWRALAERWRISDHVRFLGRVTDSELRDLYRACDVNLFPALNQSWGLTPFEALCAGRISIISNDCGAAEVLASEGIGLVCEPTEEAFTQQVLAVHESPREYQEMAERGRDYVLRQLGWDRYAERVLGLIEDQSPSIQESLEERPTGATTS